MEAGPATPTSISVPLVSGVATGVPLPFPVVHGGRRVVVSALIRGAGLHERMPLDDFDRA